jgi:hypothetical protein
MGGGEVWLNDEGYVLNVHQTSGKTVKGQVVKVSFASQASPLFAEGAQLPGQLNYFTGNDSSKWITRVPRFAGATAKNIAAGLDVRYYFDQGSPRYDLLLAPGTDPSSVAMTFEGADGLAVLPNGNLQIQTSLGPIEERGLVAYQQVGNIKIAVPCQMAVIGNSVHFKVAAYDPSRPLVIDPLLFCTYWTPPSPLTTNGPAKWICTDSAGNVITFGGTTATNYPTSTGAYQSTSVATFNSTAGYVAKFSPDGTHLLSATYLSGTGFNNGNKAAPDTIISATTDSTGDIYLTGTAGSADFPTTPGAYQTTKKTPTAPNASVFVAELSPDCTRLIFSTFLGGSKYGKDSGDYGTAIALDSHGNVIVAGSVGSLDFPLTSGSYDTTRNLNDPTEGFVAKFDATGRTLVFSTLIPGTFPGNDAQSLVQLAVDSADDIYVGGYVNPTFFRPTSSQYNISNGNGFLGKLSGDGKKLLFGIQLGPILSIGLSPTGVVFASGDLGSTHVYPSTFDMPATFHFTTSGANAVVGQFTRDGSKLLHSSVLTNKLRNMIVDGAGNIYLNNIEDTYSGRPNLPTTSDAYQKTEGIEYLAELSPEQDRLLYGSFFGPPPNNQETIGDFAMATINRFVLADGTSGEAMPVTPGAYNTTSGDFFAALLSLPIYAHVELTPNPVVGGQSVAGRVTIPAAAPSGGAVITLTSSDTGVKMPSTVTIPAGALTQIFTATTTGVSASTTSTVSAKYGVGVGMAQLVRTQAVLTTFTATPAGIVAGQTSTGTLLLNGSAGPGGDLVQLSSSNTNLTVPASVPIYNGSNQAAFQIKTVAGTSDYTAQITAKFGTVTKTLQIDVEPSLTGLTVSPSSVVAGAAAQGVVKLSGKTGSSGVAVTLSSSNVAAGVPATVTVPSGATLAAFSITTGGVDVATTVTISAKQGSLVQTATLTVQPAVLSFFTLNPASVKGGTGVQGIVRLNGLAGPSGVSVSLSSPSTLATVPAKVIIAPGASYYVFAIGTKPVAKATAVSLKASSGAAITATLTINP